jgi:polyisoprenoid-binding protein YceI
MGGSLSATGFAERHPRGCRIPRVRGVIGALGVLLAVATTAAGEREVYVVDAETSRVRVHLGQAGLLGFLGHDHEIEAPIAEGRIDVDPGNPAGSQVDLRWSSAALAVVPGTEPAEDIPKVEERMRGPEVLNVGEYPGIRFWSFDIRTGESEPEAGRWRLRVKGGLELKGSRHTVEVPMDVRREGDTVVASGEVELRLSRLGVRPPSVAGVVKVSDEFRISFEVHARRSAE